MRKLATAAFAFAAGVFLAQYCLPQDWQIPLGICFALLGMLGVLLKGNARRRMFLLCGGMAFALVYNRCYIFLVQ